MEPIDWVAIGGMFVIFQLLLTVIVVIFRDDHRVKKLEDEIIEKGYGQRVYTKRKYGIFEWKENKP